MYQEHVILLPAGFRHRVNKVVACVCVVAFFFVFSCTSKNVTEDARYETYSTFDLFFTFTYPTTWSIFEQKNEVEFSNSVVLLTEPKDERSLKPQSFLGKIYISNSRSIEAIHTDITQHALFLSLPHDGVFAEQAQNTHISIKELQKLSDIITDNAYKVIQSSYAQAFKEPLSTYARGYTIGETVLLVDGFLEQETVSENSNLLSAKMKEGVVIRATAVRKIQNNIFAISGALYHTGLFASPNKEDLFLAIDREEQHQVFLQNLVHAVQSVQIDASSSERE